MKDIRLIIWDMDETFWEGTLSEGNVTIPEENILIIKKLCDRGIMNSICSKNDFADVKDTLENAGLWDFFVYPKISWNPKGAQIKDIVEWSQLRPETILFIDDNNMNLNEAKFYVPKIQTASPDYIHQILDDEGFTGKNDINHNRLKQYKLLEKKAEEKKKYETNEDFLYASKIQVNIVKTEDKHTERVFELIKRTNQLNFTKIRLENIDQLKKIIHDDLYDCGCVFVSDSYGEYGLTGFYAKKGNTLEHFLFSCRTIGLGVEQYVYASLGYPEITCVGETAVKLNTHDESKWINYASVTEERKTETSNSKKHKCLFIGGCDFEQVLFYLEGNSSIELTAELNYCSGRYNIHREHSEILREALELAPEEKNWIIEHTPFYDDNVFNTTLTDTEYDVIIYSPLIDYSLGVYEAKENASYKVAFANFDRPLAANDKRIDDAAGFLNLFGFAGRTLPERLIENLKFVRSKVGDKTLFIIINGSEVNIRHPEEVDRYLLHKEMNLAVDKFISEDVRARLIDVRKIVTSESQHLDTIRHYTRNIYFELAKRINVILNEEKIGELEITDKHTNKNEFRKKLKAFLRKIGVYKLAYTIYRKFKS